MSRKPTTIIIASLLLLIGAVAFGFWKTGTENNSAEAAATRTGLVGWWTMDANDISGTTVYDKSGLGNHGTGTNITTADLVSGKINQALDFDQTTEIISVNSTASSTYSPTSAVTVSVWLKVRSISVADLNYYVRHTTDALTNGFTLFAQTNGLRFAINHYSTNQAYFSMTPNDNKWHHVVGTYDKNASSNQVNIYVDGVAGTPDTYAGDIVYMASDQLFFGRRDAVGGVGIDGILDDVRIYNRALSAQEVAQLYNSAKTSYSQSPQRASSTPVSGGKLVGWWTMDVNDMSATGATHYDKSGFKNHGTVTGTTTSTGMIGQARSFNGTSDKITLSALNGLDSGNAVTISAWIKPSVVDGTQNIIINRSSQLRLEITSANLPQALFGNGSTWCSDGVRGSSSINAGQWVHLVGTYTGATERLYQNGIEVGTPYSCATASWSAGVVQIGAYSSASYEFPGSIDDVRVYNYALSAQEVANLYSASAKNYTAAPPREGLAGWWTMDVNDMSATGATHYDKSGFKNHGTVTGTTTSTGRIGQSRTFNGTSDQVSLTTTGLPTGAFGAMTVSLWVKPSVVQSNKYVFEYGLCTSNNQWAIINNSTSWSWSNCATGDISSTSTPRIGQWDNITTVYDGIKKYFYINGVLENAITYSSFSITDSAIQLGSYHGANFYAGQIDDVRIYNRALSTAEVANLYQSAKRNYVQ